MKKDWFLSGEITRKPEFFDAVIPADTMEEAKKEFENALDFDDEVERVDYDLAYSLEGSEAQAVNA